ncbi:uncharacterized protein LOC142984301 [Anticarsia gemmatalis]|uniref:uncharacterized protein LOC142984301 n=1 Tax=Anticarsia gemmatalis TaxID=129554 RepID=UPI003F75F13A
MSSSRFFNSFILAAFVLCSTYSCASNHEDASHDAGIKLTDTERANYSSLQSKISLRDKQDTAHVSNRNDTKLATLEAALIKHLKKTLESNDDSSWLRTMLFYNQNTHDLIKNLIDRNGGLEKLNEAQKKEMDIISNIIDNIDTSNNDKVLLKAAQLLLTRIEETKLGNLI